MAETPQKAEKPQKKEKRDLYWVHVVIGFVLLILFSYVIPAPDPITPLGMKIVGAFIMMVYTWSTVGTLWPSLLGLFFVGISGIGGDAGFNGVWMKAVGNYTVLLVLFGMVLFGAVDIVGDTLYITKWIKSSPGARSSSWRCSIAAARCLPALSAPSPA